MIAFCILFERFHKFLPKRRSSKDFPMSFNRGTMPRPTRLIKHLRMKVNTPKVAENKGRITLILLLLISITAATVLTFSNNPDSSAPARRTRTTPTTLVATHDPVEITASMDAQDAWKIIGTAIIKDDKAMFRTHSTDEVYKLVVLPHDVNGSQDVVIDSHWDILGGRRKVRPDEPESLPETRGPGGCTNDDTFFSQNNQHRDGYTCSFMLDTENATPIAYFYLKRTETSWVVVAFGPQYG